MIAVAEKVYGRNDEEYKKLTSLVGLSGNLSEEKEEKDEKSKKTTWRDVWHIFIELWKWLFRSNEKAAMIIRIAVVAWLFLIVSGLLVVVFGKAEVASFLVMLLFGPIVLALFAAIEKGTKHKLVATLHISQPSTQRPRLSYPEQFELEFDKCVKSLAEQKQRLVVVVDDLDRCDEASVVSALAVIKQFAGKANCVFIVPCDENQVLRAVSRGNNEHDYSYESLRKFFDVAVRMDNIPEADLHNYAKYLVDMWKLSPRLAEIAVYSGARDARKVKAFLNSFKTRYCMMKGREPEYFESGTAQRNIELIAKLTALQEGFPKFYKEVCADPSILSKVEESMRIKSKGSYDEKQMLVDVDSIIKSDEVLERFLRYTSDIDLSEISEIIAGKRPESIAQISTGSFILAALAEAKIEKFVDAAKKLDSNEAIKLVDYIHQQIRSFQEKGLDVSLRIFIQCSLAIFSSENVWTVKELIRVKKNWLS